MGTKKVEKPKAELMAMETKTVSDHILTFVINDQKTMSEATELLSQINKQSDAITKEKEKVTKPLNAALNAERKRWKPAEDAIKKAKDHLRKQMSEYQTKQMELADDERNKIAGRVGSGKGKLKLTTAAQKIAEVTGPEKTVEAESGSISFKTDYEVTVTDVRLIPEQYLEVDITGIKNAIKDGEEVPGVTYKKIQVPINRRN